MTPRAAMEAQLAAMPPLEFPSTREPTVEWTAFPSLCGIYWQLARQGRVPTQAEFVEAVWAATARLPRAGVRGRAARTYPSLVRQHHAELLLRERFPVVVWSEYLDHHGVDLLVVDAWFAVGVALSTDTPLSHRWRQVKQQRHPDPPGLPILEVWAEPCAYRVGPFWLHPPTLLDEVASFLKREQIRHGVWLERG